MSGFRSFFHSEKNRGLVAWWGGGAIVIIAGLWAVLVYFFLPESGAGDRHGGVSVNGNSGSIAIGANVSNSTIAASSKPRGETEIAPRGGGCSGGFIADVLCQAGVIDQQTAKSLDAAHSAMGRPLDHAANQAVDAVVPGLGPDVTPTPGLEMRALGLKLAALPKGDIVLDAPKEMRVGDKRQVDANVGINVPMEILQKKSRAGDQQVKGQSNISSEMIVTLNGPGFKIDAITPEQQRIAEGFPTVWSWNVEAKESGDQELEATLYAILENGRQRVNSYTHRITVSVREKTWYEWLESLGHEIDTVKAAAITLFGIATAVWGWFGIRLTRQRKNSGDIPSRRPKKLP